MAGVSCLALITYLNSNKTFYLKKKLKSSIFEEYARDARKIHPANIDCNEFRGKFSLHMGLWQSAVAVQRQAYLNTWQ